MSQAGVVLCISGCLSESHERVSNGLVGDYTMWFNSIVPQLHGFCVSDTEVQVG
jgi:hypothetical protein